MWGRLAACLAMTACFSARPVGGTPCSPALDNCPDGLTCTLVDGDHVCTAPGGDPADAAPDPTGDAAPVDGSPAAPWALVQTSGSLGRTTSIAASGAGHLIIVAVETSDLGDVDAVTDNANNAYVPVVGSRSVNDAEDFGIELWFAKNSNAGATRVTAAPEAFGITVWEVAGIDKVDPLVTVTHVDDQAPSTTPRGAAIATTATGQFVVSAIIVANTISGVVAGNPFTNDETTFGNGFAHLTDAAAPAGTYEARWSQAISGASCATSAVFRTP